MAAAATSAGGAWAQGQGAPATSHIDVDALRSSALCQNIYRFHREIRADLAALAEATHALHGSAGAGSRGVREGAVRRAIDRMESLYKMYTVHSHTEDEVALKALDTKVSNVSHGYGLEHASEERLFEQLRSALFAALACADSGGGEGGGDALDALDAGGLGGALCDTPEGVHHLRAAANLGEAVRLTLSRHLDKEESQLFPLFAAHFNDDEQQRIVDGMRLSMNAVVSAGTGAGAHGAAAGDGDGAHGGGFEGAGEGAHEVAPSKQAACADATTGGGHPVASRRVGVKRKRLPPSPAPQEKTPGASGAREPTDGMPVDSIFQMHEAIRSDLRALEHESAAISAAVADAAAGGGLRAKLSALRARAHLLEGLYRAHSDTEDTIIFPALERRKALAHVSHNYTLDHQCEGALFDRTKEAIDATLQEDAWLGGSAAGGDEAPKTAVLASRACDVAEKCVALRMSLEQHLACEEQELWPLFTKHVPEDEQRELIGQIMGQTGAEVLLSMIEWVKRSDADGAGGEKLVGTLMDASEGSGFATWLTDVMGKPGAGAGAHAAAGGGADDAGAHPGGGADDAGGAAPEQAPSDEGLASVVEYLTQKGQMLLAPTAQDAKTEPAALARSASAQCFRPSWSDLFRMKQSELEMAARSIGADPDLAQERKAYLLHNLMSSRWILAAQGGPPKESVVAAAGGAGASKEAAGAEQKAPAGAVPAGGAAPLAPGAAAAGIAAGTALRANNNVAVDGTAKSAQATSAAATTKSWYDESAGTLGCQHYARNCRLIAPCCMQVVSCRICHDESLSTCGQAMERRHVTTMECMLCGTRGPVGAACTTCGERMASYYCDVCKLLDNSGRAVYHCPLCNVCRVGEGLGVDFQHCMKCNTCVPFERPGGPKHMCRGRATDESCSICLEGLFNSTDAVRELPCGHMLHQKCFEEYTRSNYGCPICRKSVGDMTAYFTMLDRLLAAEGRESLPEEVRDTTQRATCHDCGEAFDAPFHWVYHKCGHCGSYNTSVVG